MKKIYHSMAAMNSGLFLLVLLGLLAALGSAFLPELFFKTRVFMLLLLLLMLNLSLCTLNRLISLGKMLSRPFKIRPGLVRVIGLLLLHMGLVFIIAGGALYTYYGQSGQISLHKSESADISRLMSLKEPFSLYLDDFKIKFNEDGSSSQYYSDLTVLKEGKPQQKYSISVNHPLDYGGVKAYQMSFGYFVKVQLSNAEGQQHESLYKEGDFLKIEGSPYRLKIYRYLPNFDPELGMISKTMRPDNPRIVFSVYKNGQLQGVGAARFAERVKLDDDNYVVFDGVELYTVLKLKSDPGLPLVLAGGLMLILGLALAWMSSAWQRKRRQLGVRADERAALLMSTSKRESRGCYKW